MIVRDQDFCNPVFEWEGLLEFTKFENLCEQIKKKKRWFWCVTEVYGDNCHGKKCFMYIYFVTSYV